ncbi:MAG TPA: DNA-processing protein DprA [Gemmatimonadales bacterium]|nr:DNA-processing protein DprA [Gemmatimonadales bacterium]
MDATVSLPRLAATIGGVRTARALIADGAQAINDHWESLDPEVRTGVSTLRDRLLKDRVGLLLMTDRAYPERLRALRSPPPFLFFRGNLALVREPGIGMCGARNVSERGLEAARACGEEVARRDWHVISGYAKGVDTETHLAALRTGAGTVIVLAEGILHFRRKRAFADVPFTDETVLALSQFSPAQRWSAGAAMTRNGIIAALGGALIVIEAGERGGTLNAGEQALGMGRPVFALDFSAATPPGNRKLFAQGAGAIRTRGELASRLADLDGSSSPTTLDGHPQATSQGSLFPPSI